jgi:hypothetical protein
MSYIRLTVAILLVVLTSSAGGPAMAQNAEQPTEASVRQANLPHYYVFQSDTLGMNANTVRPDDGLSET